MPTEKPQRIYITGTGIVSPLGLDWRQNEESFAADRTAFRPVTLFDVSQRIAKTAASVDLPGERLFSRMPARREALIDRSTKMLLLALREALAMAGLPGLQGIDAIVMGTSAGAMMIGQDYFRHARSSPRRQPGQLSRLEFYQPQRQLRAIAEEYDWQGPMIVVSNACASGANAIGDAMAMIRSGRARRVLAGGYDALAELVYSGFDCLRALAPSGIPRPFDAERDGLALGEGAAVVILECEDAAAERGAEALCEAVGYCTATDLHHLTQPDPEGKAATRTMAGACVMAGLLPEQIGYINSHGTGTPYNDVSEAAAIAAWAGDSVGRIAVSSTKSAMGHLLGGAGAVEAVICIMALCGQWLPGSLNIRQVDPAVRFDLVRAFRRTSSLRAVLTNSFGFGGTNASLVLAETGYVRRPGSVSPASDSRVIVSGAGAVSAAGWGCAELAAAVTSGVPLPAVDSERPAGTRDWACPIFTVPAPAPEHLPRFPRLRRASPITRFAMGAALEALEAAGFSGGVGIDRLGIIQCMFNGCVQFSGKFYREVLETPTLASPLIFPETVYNAPASHIAAYLKADGPVTTLVGEANIFVEALRMAQTWLREGLVDHCLVIGAEECDWLGAEAATYYHRDLRAGEGAGALLVGIEGDGVRLTPMSLGALVADAITASNGEAAPVRIDNHAGIAQLDKREASLWQGASPTTALHPRAIVGETMGAAAALQLALAVHVSATARQTVHVSMPGGIGSDLGAKVVA